MSSDVVYLVGTLAIAFILMSWAKNAILSADKAAAGMLSQGESTSVLERTRSGLTALQGGIVKRKKMMLEFGNYIKDLPAQALGKVMGVVDTMYTIFVKMVRSLKDFIERIFRRLYAIFTTTVYLTFVAFGMVCKAIQHANSMVIFTMITFVVIAFGLLKLIFIGPILFFAIMIILITLIAPTTLLLKFNSTVCKAASESLPSIKSP